MTLGNRIQELRKKQSLSQEAFAEVMGVTRQSVSKWELDQSYPAIDKLIEMVDYFHISLDEMLRNEANTPDMPKGNIQDAANDTDDTNNADHIDRMGHTDNVGRTECMDNTSGVGHVESIGYIGNEDHIDRVDHIDNINYSDDTDGKDNRNILDVISRGNNSNSYVWYFICWGVMMIIALILFGMKEYMAGFVFIQIFVWANVIVRIYIYIKNKTNPKKG